MSAEGGDELMDLGSIPISPRPSSFIFSIFSELPASPLWSFSDHSASPPTGGLLVDDSDGFVSDPLGEKNSEDAGNSRLVQISMGTATEENDSDFVGSCIIKEMIQQALRSVKDSIEQHFLVQVWAPVKDGSRYVLSTSGQPFALDPHSSGLLQYRSVSLMYLFSVDGKNGFSGLPGRVFRQKLPEWTPNVQYYTSMEYPRRSYALDYNIRGTLALPIFGPGQSCVAVLELILTSQKINFASEVDKVCKALKAVKLKSSDILEHPSRQICNEGRQAALGEILEMLTVTCETYELPLAQTWVPCMHRNVLAYGGGSKKSCTGIDGICMGQVCMSTTDVAFYVVDAHMWGFRDACVEHHLQKGQGAAGRAFLLHRPCFARDVKNFCKTEYPLVHYARMFGLAGCLAICLRSFLTESDDYVVEFFLPPSCVDHQDQKELIKCLTTTMRERFRTLRVTADHDLQEDEILDITELKADGNPESKIGSGLVSSLSSSNLNNRPLLEDLWLNVSDNEVGLLQNLQKDVMCEELDNKKNEDNVENTKTQMLISEDKTDHASQRKRGKTEKSISLEVLQQYFSGSLKDAAKSLGVCPTTMKRICRQHGISRWPSRKISKVNRTLTKLKSVIESVHGGEGVFGLASLTPISVGSKSASRTRSGSADDNVDTPASQYSSQHNLGGEAHINILQSVCPTEKLDLNTKSFPVEEPSGGASQLVACELPDALMATEPLTPLDRGMLRQDSGIYKEFTELNNSAADYSQLQLPNAQGRPPQTQTFPPLAASQEVPTVTIKANYKEDIIRFRLPLSSCMVDLAGEISKRLKLDIGTFNVKYLDVDHEWMLATCDSDLRECLEVASSSSRNLIRLSVHDIDANLGSSCESSDE